MFMLDSKKLDKIFEKYTLAKTTLKLERNSKCMYMLQYLSMKNNNNFKIKLTKKMAKSMLQKMCIN